MRLCVVRVVRDILECSQRYVGVKSEKCWSVTPEMVCCWQLENVVGSQRYVGGKQRYVRVQSEIFWNVGMSQKNMAFFFSFFQNCIYVYVGIYLDGIQRHTATNLLVFLVFLLFVETHWFTHTSRITLPKKIATNKSKHEKTETAIDLYIIYDSINIMAREHSL